jgi:hypothetical protein
MSRTGTNSKYVTRHVERRFEELLNTAMPSTLSSLLAQAHAFILYLSLQVFSNDVCVFPMAYRILHKD